MTNHCAKLHCFTCTCIYKQMLIKGTDVSFNYSILLSFNREPNFCKRIKIFFHFLSKSIDRESTERRRTVERGRKFNTGRSRAN